MVRINDNEAEYWFTEQDEKVEWEIELNDRAKAYDLNEAIHEAIDDVLGGDFGH